MARTLEQIQKRIQLRTPTKYIQWGKPNSHGRPYYIRFKPNPGFFIPWFGGKALHKCWNKKCTRRRIQPRIK